MAGRGGRKPGDLKIERMADTRVETRIERDSMGWPVVWWDLAGAAPDLDPNMYHALLANAADFMVDRFDADVAFVPMERSVLDSQHSHAVIAKMLRAQRARVLNGEFTSGQLLSLMGHFDFAVGMRLHFLIFAALRGVPFVALPYAGKVAGFLEDLKLPSPPLHLVNPGRLKDFFVLAQDLPLAGFSVTLPPPELEALKVWLMVTTALTVSASWDSMKSAL